MALKWGKGYAWNPVGFVERANGPNDVELAHEGYTMVAADFIRNFSDDGGDLKGKTTSSARSRRCGGWN